MAAPMAVDVGSQGCIYNYHVTAQRATSVTHSAVGNFTSSADINLIVARRSHLEVYTLTADGLKSILQVPIYGRISALQLYRPKGAAKDLLFFLTDHSHVVVLDYDAAGGKLVTHMSGAVSDSVGKPLEGEKMGVVDPEARALVLHLYGGLIKVVPLEEKAAGAGGAAGGQLEAFNARIEQLDVVGLVALAGCPVPTIALLYEDNGARHVTTYAISTSKKELGQGPDAATCQNLEAGSSLLVALPAALGGLMVLGETQVTYLHPSAGIIKTVALPHPTTMRSCTRIDDDGTRWLLSDYAGVLYLLVVAHAEQGVTGLKVQVLGRTSSASTLSYLDSGMVFVGARGGDSQLIKLHQEPVTPATGDQPASYVEVVAAWPCLGPVLDIAVMDLDRQGQGQLVTCSGMLGDGSLRVVRNGIGISETASLELPGIRGLWALRPGWLDAYDTHLVLTFVGETRVLAITAEDELEEVGLPGLDSEAQTWLAANTLHDQLLQVTSSAVRLLAGSSGELLTSWSPPGGRAINTAAAAPAQVLVATAGGWCHLLEVTQGGTLVEVGSVQLQNDISCVALAPADDAGRSPLAAVGTWDMQVLLLATPGLTPAAPPEPLGGSVLPRSVLLVDFEGTGHLLVGLGDGGLLHWKLDPGSQRLTDKKSISLGTKPLQLVTFTNKGVQHVFAGSDRPTIIYSNNGKLLYSNLNEDEVSCLSTFNSASFPDRLALAKEDALTLGTIDGIQQLHISAVPLGEQPRRVAQQPATRSLGVLMVGLGPPGAGFASMPSSLRVVDDITFDTLASLPLQPNELGNALTSCQFEGDEGHYYIVGTCFIKPGETEPSKGRILVVSYRPAGRTLDLVQELEVRGACYALCPFQGQLLATVNSRVLLLRNAKGPGGAGAAGGGGWDLVEAAAISVQTTSLYLATRGDFIVVGDLMKSISLLQYKPSEVALEVRGRDLSSRWLTALAALDEDTYLAADNECNLVVVMKNPDAATDEERHRLTTVGLFHTGESINRIVHGSLVMQLPDGELSGVPTVLYGSVDGAIGLVASLPKDLYDLLAALQEEMRKVVHGVGGLKQEEWRQYRTLLTKEPARGFVDGDLVEAFLDLPPSTAAQVVAALGKDVTLEAVTHKVEELSRLH